MHKCYRVGAHEILVEEDICFLKPRGSLNLEQVKFYHDLVLECFRQHGRNFSLIDMEHSGSIDADARRWTAQWHREHQISGAALFGGSAVIRITYNLVTHGVTLVSKKPVRIVFFKTEVEAREWIATVQAGIRL